MSSIASVWRRVRIGDITAAEASTRLSELLNAPVASASMEPYLDQALVLAAEISHPVYDASILHSLYSSRRILSLPTGVSPPSRRDQAFLVASVF